MIGHKGHTHNDYGEFGNHGNGVDEGVALTLMIIIVFGLDFW